MGVLAFSRNFGQVTAVVEGLRRARGDAAVVLSADLQDPVEQVERMIEAWENGSRIVVCHRARRDDGLATEAASRLFFGLMRISQPRLPEGGFDFLLLDRRPLDVLNSFGGRNRFFQGDVLWLGFTTTFLPYERRARAVGRSQWTLGMRVKYFLDGLLSTTYWPIRLMSLCGIATALAGFVYAGAIVYARVHDDVPFTGWAPIMILLLVLGGGLMAMVGVVGEYVWRIYDEVRGRPPVAVEAWEPPGTGGEGR